ncbi:hypothetical protein [Kitasatospora camelliae]|uniref:PknH-like protein n=1 Tax=Kitasatospora camelliae TaxID=3156397 RepID=A0AAU8JQK9_9ACTN
MPFRVPRPAPLHAVLTAAALAVTGCSGGGGTPATAPASARPSAPPLTTTQLRDTTFRKGEVPQMWEVDGMGVSERKSETGGRTFPPATVQACQTMNEISAGRRATAVVYQILNWKEQIFPGGTTLAAYEDGAAERAFRELKESLGSCRTYDDWGYVGRIHCEVVPEPAPQAGDEAISYRQLSPAAGELSKERNEQFIVVRTGNVLVTFTVLDVGQAPSFPPELVTKQVERLRDAQRR